MRALAKVRPHPGGMVYTGQGDRLLRDRLVEEQGGWCAYSERRLLPLDSVDIEHLDDRLKGAPGDGWSNWYAVLHRLNQKKLGRDRRHIRESDPRFFVTRFFQEVGALEERVRYVPGDYVFEPRDRQDTDADAFLRYVGVNDPDVVIDRRQHIRMLQDLGDSGRAIWAHHLSLQHYPTAVVLELGWPDPVWFGGAQGFR